MESVYHEQRQESTPVVRTVRDRVVSFHDKYLRVCPISDDVAKRFSDIVPVVQSEKGKAVIARLRPKIATYAKNIELSAATADILIGTIGAVIFGTYINRARTTKLIDESKGVFGKPLVKKGSLGGLVFGGSLLRPVSRITDFAFRHGTSITKRIAGAVDAIALRRQMH